VWARHLEEQAQSPAVLAELPAWETILDGGGALLPDVTIAGPVATESLRVELPAHITAALLTKVPAAFHARINDVLLAALAVAIDRPILVDVEGHGRESDRFDLSRTVGWFTSMFPVRIDAAGAPIAQALKRVKEQLRAVPEHGLGYGLLRYLNDDTAPRLAQRAQPQIAFNYLGRFDEGADSVKARGEESHLHLLTLAAATVGTQLIASWSWSTAHFTEADVRAIAKRWERALDALVRAVAEDGVGGHTPSDFPLVPLTLAQVEQLEAAYPALDDVLPLSPLQEGLVFQSMFDERARDVYTVQIVVELEGALDGARLRDALRLLLRRHPNLGVAIRHDGFERPVQVVTRDVDVPWRFADVAREELEAVLAADRAERFVLSQAPLLRCMLLRLAADRHVLVLTNHHALMDGWSMPLFFSELFALYRGGDDVQLPRAQPYADYLAWLAKQDRNAALDAWREHLAELDGATRVSSREASQTIPERCTNDVPAELTARLQRYAREHGVTLNTVIQTLWAALLGHLTGRDDVVFGVTVAGRPAELAGVERMIGQFINTLPLRVRLDRGERVPELLRRVQDEQARLLPHQHVGLAEIQSAAGLGELFDTLVVFENYPTLARSADALDLEVVASEGHDATHYALSLIVVPGERMHLRLDYDPARVERAVADGVLARLPRAFEAVVAQPDVKLHQLPLL
ncbi:MAG TPA: condensation domain-containing protein, partial [Thermoanaerobaculia bacterium]